MFVPGETLKQGHKLNENPLPISWAQCRQCRTVNCSSMTWNWQQDSRCLPSTLQGTYCIPPEIQFLLSSHCLKPLPMRNFITPIRKLRSHGRKLHLQISQLHRLAPSWGSFKACSSLICTNDRAARSYPGSKGY